MYRYRQNIQKRNSNALKSEALQQYGLAIRNANTSRKELKSKSKSHKDILIAKNKKLPESFNMCHSTSHSIKSPRNKQLKLNERQQQFKETEQKNATATTNKQYGFEALKTSFFGGESQINKQNKLVKHIKQNSIHPQTYASDRAEAFELRQRLKKSTSMKNLIEQKFLYDNQRIKTEHRNLQTQKNQGTFKDYDSTKYNWRLSRSKQKLSREKSMSALSCRAKLICEINKKDSNRNKLTLNNTPQNQSSVKLKLKSQQTIQSKKLLHYSIKQPTTKISDQGTHEKQKLAYTFGSDVFNSHNFN